MAISGSLIAVGIAAGVTAGVGIVVGASAFVISGLIFLSNTFIISGLVGGVSRLLTPKPPRTDFNSLANLSSRTINVRQAIETHKVIYGQARVGAFINFVESTGVSNQFLHVVGTLGVGGPYQEIGDVWLDDVVITAADLDANGIVTTGKYANLVRIKKHLGAYNQTADSDLTSETSADSTVKGGGACYLYVRLEFDTDKFLQLPNISAVVKGRKIYDMRGSPTQDPDDPDTWGWSDNAALVALDYLRGVPAKDGTGTVVRRYGVNVADTAIDMDSFSTAADTSDEAVALAGSPETQELRYTANGVMDTAESPDQAIENLRTSFAGDFIYSGGVWSILAGSFSAATVPITASDLRGHPRITTRITRRSLFNAVKGVYISPEHNWQATDYPPITSTTYEDEDNGERIWFDFPQPFQIRSAAAQRIAKIEMEKVRRQISVILPCKLTAFRIRVGDTIAVTYDRFGWEAKTFLVTTWKFAQDRDEAGEVYLGIDLELREYDSTVFAWTAEENEVSVPPGSTLPDPFAVANPTSLTPRTITSMTLASDKIYQLAMSWTSPADVFVTSGGQLEIQWKRSGSSSWNPSFFVAGNQKSTFVAVAVFQFGEFVDFRIRGVNSLGVRASVWQTELMYEIGSTAAEVNADDGLITEVAGSPTADDGLITDVGSPQVTIDDGSIT